VHCHLTAADQICDVIEKARRDWRQESVPDTVQCGQRYDAWLPFANFARARLAVLHAHRNMTVRSLEAQTAVPVTGRNSEFAVGGAGFDKLGRCPSREHR